MAGAGYKLFATGDVLTAAQVNTYLQEQTVMVFNDAASRTTALSGVLAEGMVSYLKSTKVVEIYNGTAWASLDDPNAIQNTIVDAKGDLISASAADVPARLAVGNNGETLVADSSASTGLRWQPTQSTQNYIINGGADFWQRGTSAAATLNYLCDRFQFNRAGGAAGSTISRSTDAPTGFQYSIKNQRDSGNTSTAALEGYYSIETSQSLPLAGQTVVLSFYAKKGANYSGGNFSITLANGTGTDQAYYSYTGSNNIVNNTGISLTTSWVRYSVTGTVPTNSTEIGFKTSWTPTGTAGADDSVYMTGFQLEVGSVPTTFTRAGGTLAGELAACQRYYWRATNNSTYSVHATGWATSTTAAKFALRVPTTMRVVPTSIDYSGLGVGVPGASLAALTNLTIGSTESALNTVYLNATVASGLTSGATYVLQNNNNTGDYVGCSAEL